MAQFMKKKLTLRNVLFVFMGIIVSLLLGVAIRLILIKDVARNNVPPALNVILPPGVSITNDVITPQEAFRRAALLPGANQEISSGTAAEIKALTDKNGSIDYWSIKTTRGYVTIKAK